MGNIACKCNKQQDHSELDLNKDKQELLKSIQTKDQNSPIDNFISDQNKHSVHSQRENLNEQANNHDLSKNGSANFKDDNNPKNGLEIMGNTSNPGICENAEEFTQKSLSNNNNNRNEENSTNNVNNFLSCDKAEIPLQSSHITVDAVNHYQPTSINTKPLTHLKSNSNEIKMDIYDDENYQQLNNIPALKNLKNEINAKKKYTNSNQNPMLFSNNLNSSKQPPLEVIKELNADASKESFYENKSIANKNKSSDNQEIKDTIENNNEYNSLYPNDVVNVDAKASQINQNFNTNTNSNSKIINSGFDDINEPESSRNNISENKLTKYDVNIESNKANVSNQNNDNINYNNDNNSQSIKSQNYTNNAGGKNNNNMANSNVQSSSNINNTSKSINNYNNSSSKHELYVSGKFKNLQQQQIPEEIDNNYKHDSIDNYNSENVMKNNMQNNFNNAYDNSNNNQIKGFKSNDFSNSHKENSNNNSNLVIKENQKNYSSYQGYKINQPTQTRNVKKNFINKEEKWKSLKINSIIPERVLLSHQEDIICFQSEIKKLTQTMTSFNKENFIYTARFSLLNKVCLKIYKNRENFLRLQKPQTEIPFNNIKDCNYIQLHNNPKGGSGKAFHFYINYIMPYNEGRLEDKIENDSSIMDKSTGKIKKISYLDSQNISKDNSMKKSIDNSTDFQANPVLIFACEEEDLANKWIAVINYFMKK